MPSSEGSIGTVMLVALLLLFCLDLAQPAAPGAYRPLDMDAPSVLEATLVVQATAAVTPPTLQPRPPETGRTHAPLRLTMQRGEPLTARPFAVPLVRSPQLVAEAPTSEEPA